LTNHRSVLLELARFLSRLVWTAIATDAPVPPADEGVRRCLRHWAWTPPPECDPFYLSETNGTTTTWWSKPAGQPGRAGLGFAETLDLPTPPATVTDRVRQAHVSPDIAPDSKCWLPPRLGAHPGSLTVTGRTSASCF